MLFETATPALLALACASMGNAIPLEASNDSTSRSRRWLPGADKIRGVNLGSQFIIEPWMATDEWNSMGCGGTNDEWSCVQALGQDAADEAFKTHWDSWITQDDISQISGLGLNTVRIPVGFWIKEDLVNSGEYYPRGGLEYLDRIVGWCADAGLYVIMDLHGGPGSQTDNQQFTGHSVDYPGWFTTENYERTYQFLEWMAERIHTTDAYRNVGMLEVMNEPGQSYKYASEAADMVANFYPNAMTRIRDRESSLGVSSNNLLHIQYMATAWGSGDPSSDLPNTNFVMYDDHRYLKWDDSVTRSKEGYISAACSDDRGGSDVIVGEWSISVADDVEGNDEFGIADRPDQVEWYRSFWAAQVQSYEKSGGWVFWSWKCNWINAMDEWRWCYQSAVAAGVIPEDAGSAASISPC
ncbi:glycoside hydrolase family 5 protein [Xylariomycetidae sp. FL2044]|nr:glycoside hydrolase family 5 protein [Xylariomycetidae sp. FL2044]